MSQQSLTESDNSQGSLTDARFPLTPEQRSQSRSESYEFDDLTYDLADYFLSFKQMGRRFGEWASVAEDLPQVTEFLDLLYMFVSSISNGLFTVSDEEKYLFCLECLWNPEFLSDLLGFRSAHVGTRSVDSEYQHWPIITKIFAILGMLEKVVVSSVGCARSFSEELPSSLRERQQEDMVRVAAQLPDRLHRFPDVLSSKHSSPAAKRIALSILFGLYVVEFAGNRFCDLKIDPLHFLECLQFLIRDTDPDAPCTVLARDDQGTNIQYAMIWALYSTVQCKIEREGGGTSAFQPHTQSILLSMLKCIFANVSPLDSGVSLYIESPDTAQLIVLHWGNCVPFAWSKWGDARILDFDLITNLTANWLCHLDQQLLQDFCASSFQDGDSIAAASLRRLGEFSDLNHRAAIAAISRQVKLLTDLQCQAHDTEMWLMHISRCTHIIKSFMNAHPGAVDRMTLVEDFVMILFTLDDSEKQLPVKGEILDILCSMNKQDLGNALARCRSNPKKRLEMKIEAKVGLSLRNLQARNRPGCEKENTGLTPCSLVDLLALLNLICLICSTGSTICLTASVISLLSTVISVLESGALPFACCLYAVDLRAAMLSCLASFETLHRNSGDAGQSSNARSLHKLWDDSSAFALALDANAWSHVPLSSAFATYVISNPSPLVKDRLLCIEVWNYLRDTLLLTLPQANKTGDHTSNECLKNVCKGLKNILVKQADDSAARYIRASPMMLNLLDTLRSAVGRRGEGNEGHAYADLIVACEELLGVLDKNTQDTIP
ncbi:hypothetical protein SCHPADRAFT_897840 [Schizopora paradoxa]|uniref:Uncharacterized protein n=1 Tax=Schizopora paradoxa TaxID=27342 RepID=A0A0H2SFI4_9AGAM|nr:hypothetical protein SCHPADRAFT_897840 [Schizopora paradoxa]